MIMDIDELHKRAASGDTAAETILGMNYLEGRGVDIDYAEAFRLLSAASRKGASRAIVYLASMHANGLGTPADMATAIRFYEVAANAGEVFAKIELGRIFAAGKGVPVDVATASKWYSKALDQNVADCDEMREARAYLDLHRG
jgi:TPR repeat protein